MNYNRTVLKKLNSCCEFSSFRKFLNNMLEFIHHGLQLTRLLHPWDFPGNSTGVGCHCLLPRKVTLLIKNREILNFVLSLLYFKVGLASKVCRDFSVDNCF